MSVEPTRPRRDPSEHSERDVADIPLAAIGRIVEYNWADEERDHEECAGNGNSQEHHIFNDLRVVRDWLNAAGSTGAEARL